MSSRYDTDTATLLGRESKPDAQGYISSLYRGIERNYFILGKPFKPNPAYRASVLVDFDKKTVIRYLRSWGLHEAVKKHFGDDPEAQAYIATLEGRPDPDGDPGADQRGGDPRGASPDPDKVQGKGSGESPLVQDAKRRKVSAGSSLSQDGGNPLVRNAIRRNRAQESAPDPDEEKKPEENEESTTDQDEKKSDENDESAGDQDGKESEKDDEEAPAGEEKKPEEPEESALVRNAKHRRERML